MQNNRSQGTDLWKYDGNVESRTPRILSNNTAINTHFSFLIQISRMWKQNIKKYMWILKVTVFKSALINALGDIWKFIGGSLTAQDGEYYANCSEKLIKTNVNSKKIH